MTDNEIRKHLGKLLWISICTRPDIWQIVNRLAAAIGLRSETVSKVIHRVWRWLAATLNYAIHYKKSKL